MENMQARRRRRRRSSSRTKRPPWHFWGLAFSAMILTFGAAVTYLLAQMGHEGFLSQYSPEELAFYASYPALYDAFWAISAWAGLAGSALLLLRSRFAFHAYAAALAGTALKTFWTMTRAVPDSMNTQFSWILSAGLIIAFVLLIIYARRMIAEGVIR